MRVRWGRGRWSFCLLWSREMASDESLDFVIHIGEESKMVFLELNSLMMYLRETLRAVGYILNWFPCLGHRLLRHSPSRGGHV